MIGIIVSGHGNFASGLSSAIELIAGKQDNFVVVDFNKSYSSNDLKIKIKDAIDDMEVDGYVFFTDISGGTPFKTCVELSIEIGNSEVIAGTNLPMLMEILFDRFSCSAKDIMKRSIELGKDNIKHFEMSYKKENTDIEDGI